MPTATVPNTFSNIPAATNPIDATQVNANFTAILAAINGGLGLDNLNSTALASTVKTGVIQMTGAATADTGFLLCDGGAASRTTYATLFARIGIAHGAGDGSTTFNVPNLSGRSPVGVGTATGATGATAHTLGQKAGEETHLSTGLESGVNPNGSTVSTNQAGGTVADSEFALNAHAGFTAMLGLSASGIALTSRAADAYHNNMQPYTGVNFQIKT